MGELWRKYVKDKKTAEAFLEVMYPDLDAIAVKAYADFFERAVKGEIQLTPNFIYDPENKYEHKWNY